jgi:ferritin
MRVEECVMAAGETGFSDVVYDLISVQYHALKGGYVYGQYARDAENEGRKEIAEFFRQVAREDAARAEKCHRFLLELPSTKVE